MTTRAWDTDRDQAARATTAVLFLPSRFSNRQDQVMTRTTSIYLCALSSLGVWLAACGGGGGGGGGGGAAPAAGTSFEGTSGSTMMSVDASNGQSTVVSGA